MLSRHRFAIGFACTKMSSCVILLHSSITYRKSIQKSKKKKTVKPSSITRGFSWLLTECFDSMMILIQSSSCSQTNMLLFLCESNANSYYGWIFHDQYFLLCWKRWPILLLPMCRKKKELERTGLHYSRKLQTFQKG